MRVDHTNSGLKEGQYFELIDVEDITHGMRADVEKLYPADMSTFSIGDGRRMRNTFMASLITAWSFNGAPRVDNGTGRMVGNPDALWDLPETAYKVLVESTNPHYIACDFMTDPDAGKEQTARSTSEPSSSTE